MLGSQNLYSPGAIPSGTRLAQQLMLITWSLHVHRNVSSALTDYKHFKYFVVFTDFVDFLLCCLSQVNCTACMTGLPIVNCTTKANNGLPQLKYFNQLIGLPVN